MSMILLAWFQYCTQQVSFHLYDASIALNEYDLISVMPTLHAMGIILIV